MGEKCCLCDVEVDTVPGQKSVKVWYTGSDWICAGCAAYIVELWMMRRRLSELSAHTDALARGKV